LISIYESVIEYFSLNGELIFIKIVLLIREILPSETCIEFVISLRDV